MDAQTLTTLSTALYDACYDSGRWPQAAQALRSSLNSMAATLVVRQDDSYRTVHTDCDADYSQRYWREFSANDPMLTGPGHNSYLYSDQMVMDRRRFRQSALFGDWLRPQDRHSILLLKIPDGQDIAAIFALNRGGSQRSYTPEDLDACRQIQPLLAHAVSHRRAIERLHALASAHHPSGARQAQLIVNAQRQVLQQDAAADSLLRHHTDLLDVRQKTLCPSRAQDAQRLGHAILQACTGQPSGWRRGADLLMRDHEGRPSLVLEIAPLGDAGIFGLGGEYLARITIRTLRSGSRPDAQRHLQQLFGLSPREAELAHALMQGLSLKEAAQQRNISLTTVRTQLSCLFRKTGTSRQGQLVALLARLSG